MKTLFKIWSVLIIIGAVLSIVSVVLLIGGVGALGTAIEGAEVAAGAGVLILTIAAIPSIALAIVSFIAAKAGFSGDYQKCAKFGMIMVVIDIIAVVLALFTDSSVGKMILETGLAAVYVFLAKKMEI